MVDTKIERAKKVISDYFEDACCGLFCTRNFVGDEMTTVYDYDGLVIDLCYPWAYFEVFGLSDDEFKELMNFYVSLRKDRRNRLLSEEGK